MDCSWPDSSVHGIFQARVVEWVAISSSISSGTTFEIWKTSGVTISLETWKLVYGLALSNNQRKIWGTVSMVVQTPRRLSFLSRVPSWATWAFINHQRGPLLQGVAAPCAVAWSFRFPVLPPTLASLSQTFFPGINLFLSTSSLRIKPPAEGNIKSKQMGLSYPLEDCNTLKEVGRTTWGTVVFHFLFLAKKKNWNILVLHK